MCYRDDLWLTSPPESYFITVWVKMETQITCLCHSLGTESYSWMIRGFSSSFLCFFCRHSELRSEVNTARPLQPLQQVPQLRLSTSRTLLEASVVLCLFSRLVKAESFINAHITFCPCWDFLCIPRDGCFLAAISIFIFYWRMNWIKYPWLMSNEDLELRNSCFCF